MAANLTVALDEAGKVLKKQKTCATRTDECMSRLLDLVEAARKQLLSESAMDTDDVLKNLHREIEEAGLLKEINSQTKELHAAISKMGKALDKAFDGQADICKFLRDIDFDQAELNQVIAAHFYREGRFEIGDRFAAAAQVQEAEKLKQPYVALHNVLKEIRAYNLQPALAWVQEHGQELSQDGQPSSFEFKLHSMQFIHILTTEGRAPALAYAQAHFAPFQGAQLREIQRLMACLLFARRGLAASPYADLASPGRWADLAADFTKQACNLMGQACESPLATVVAAGSVAIPALLKLATVMERNSQDLRACAQLPIELELGPEFVFHSIFACPVSRDQSGPGNPPVLLPCNHVLCEQSTLKIAKGRSRTFKCPYCPVEARADGLRPLVFPGVQ